MANLIVSAVSTFDNKGLKKGKKEVSTFEKQIKSFAKVFATAFSVRALTNYSKKAVQAFMADEKAAKSLEQQLKNTGYQFSSPSVELYIANLQKTTGVLDDELRPAFQQLLTVTGSITMSQDALSTAMNVSAATGRSLSQVTTALSRAYAGNTAGLSRLGAGLDKTLLKSGDMDKIMAKLNEKFAGQSAARLTTYAGKMDLLAAAAANSQEIIGKGLLDALTALGDDNSIEGLTTGMEDFATAISEVVVGLGQVGNKLKDLTNVPGVGNIFDVRNIPVIGAYIGGLRQIGRGAMPQQDRGGQERTAGRTNAQQFKIENRLTKAKAAELAILQKKNAIENKNVEELKKKFDLERIGLTQALNVATDDETKTRLKAQLAILDNNDAMAKKLLAELEAYEALKKLADAANKAADALDRNMNKYDAMILGLIKQFEALGLSIPESMALAGMSARYQAQADAIAAGKGPITGGTTLTPRLPALPASYFQDLATQLVGTSSYAGMNVAQIAEERARESGNRYVDVNLKIDSPSGDRFAQLMAESIQIAGRSGYSTTPNGGLQ
jgi:hypothetical protein